MVQVTTCGKRPTAACFLCRVTVRSSRASCDDSVVLGGDRRTGEARERAALAPGLLRSRGVSWAWALGSREATVIPTTAEKKKLITKTARAVTLAGGISGNQMRHQPPRDEHGDQHDIEWTRRSAAPPPDDLGGVLGVGAGVEDGVDVDLHAVSATSRSSSSRNGAPVSHAFALRFGTTLYASSRESPASIRASSARCEDTRRGGVEVGLHAVGVHGHSVDVPSLRVTACSQQDGGVGQDHALGS